MRLLLSLLVSGAAFTCVAANFDVVDPAVFNTLVPPDARLQKLGTGMGFVEGPVWVNRDDGYVVFSDIPGNELKKWTPDRGVTTFRKPSQNANGNTVDRKNRLYTAEHGGRRI